MFGAAGQSVEIVPVVRMNAVLVIAKSASQIQQAQDWVRRLDQANQDARKIFVYPVQNRCALELAEVIRSLFGGSADGSSEGGALLGSSSVTPAFPVQTAESVKGGAILASGIGAGLETRDGNLAQTGAEPRIQADTATNALVVIATPEEWRTIFAAIVRLDVEPAQVLIEATIAEVRLSDALRHGVRWFFEKGNSRISLSDLSSGAVSPSFPGFGYSFGIPNAQVILSALEEVPTLRSCRRLL